MYMQHANLNVHYKYSIKNFSSQFHVCQKEYTSLFSINQLNFTSKPRSCKVKKFSLDQPQAFLLLCSGILSRFWISSKTQVSLLMCVQWLSQNIHCPTPVVLSDPLLWSFCESQEKSQAGRTLCQDPQGPALDHSLGPCYMWFMAQLHGQHLELPLGTYHLWPRLAACASLGHYWITIWMSTRALGDSCAYYSFKSTALAGLAIPARWSAS